MSGFDNLAVPGNILERLTALEAKVRSLENKNASAVSLDEISDDLGIIKAGALLCGDGDPFDADGGFTGVVMTAPALDLPNGERANLVGMNAGQPEFWLDAATGEGVFGGGAARMNSNGGTVTGLQTAWRLEAENGGETRRASLGMYLPDGQTTPALGLILTDPTPGAELTTNGSFESGDTTGWTAVYSGLTAVVSDIAHAGIYALRYTHQGSGYVREIYSSSRIAVTSGTNYQASAWTYQEAAWIKVTGEVRWYTDSIGGSLVRTDTFLAQQAASGAWKQFTMVFAAPAIATHCEVVIRFEPDPSYFPGSTIYRGENTRAWVDGISFTEASIFASLTFEPDCTLRGSSLRFENLSSLPAKNSLPLVFAHDDQLWTMRPGISLPDHMDGLKVRRRITSAITAAPTSATGLGPVNTSTAQKYGTEGTGTFEETRFYRYNTSATINTNAGISSGTSTTVYPQWSPIYYAKIRTDATVANMRLYCGLHSDDPTTNPAPGKWITFKYESTGGVTGFVAQSNIGLFTDSINLPFLQANTCYELEIYVDYASLKIFYVVNGTVYESTPIGTWDTATALNPYIFLRTLTSASRYIKIARMTWEYD